MPKLIGAMVLVVGIGCGAAVAQTTTLPERPMPEAVPDGVRAVDAPTTAVPGSEVAPVRPMNDPNATGPDKVNGLEVPQMKGEAPAAR